MNCFCHGKHCVNMNMTKILKVLVYENSMKGTVRVLLIIIWMIKSYSRKTCDEIAQIVEKHRGSTEIYFYLKRVCTLLFGS